jgi:hypothetical protein
MMGKYQISAVVTRPNFGWGLHILPQEMTNAMTNALTFARRPFYNGTARQRIRRAGIRFRPFHNAGGAFLLRAKTA